MAKCKTCGAPVSLAPDGDPKYSPQRTDRTDIEGQRLCAALRQEGYLVPYAVMLKAIQAAALEAQPN